MAWTGGKVLIGEVSIIGVPVRIMVVVVAVLGFVWWLSFMG